jgi:carboxyl-terminal processing protease
MAYKWRKLCNFFCCLFMLGFALPAHAEAEPSAKAYLDQALDLIRLHHRYSAQGDWPKIIAEAHIEIGAATTTKDTYPAIRRALAKLNEPHSFLVEPSVVPQRSDAKMEKQQEAAPRLIKPEWQLVSGRIGVTRLSELNTLGAEGQKRGAEYMSAVRNGLMTMDKSKICGWIIDLRQNGGGDMWPMLRGLDPLLGPSPFGAFLPAKEKKQNWVRASGNIFPISEKLEETPPAFQLKHSNAPVALLVGPQTASSGEMVAIAFVGRKNTRLFGSPTAGFTSANAVWPLSDGAYLVLTMSSVADREGREYSGPIVPEDSVASEKAEAVAKKWLKKRC